MFPCILFIYFFFFEKDRLLFSVWGKTIFLGKRNIIFPDNTRKIKFQHDFFGKVIFSGHLKKENMVFQVVVFSSDESRITLTCSMDNVIKTIGSYGKKRYIDQGC